MALATTPKSGGSQSSHRYFIIETFQSGHQISPYIGRVSGEHQCQYPRNPAEKKGYIDLIDHPVNKIVLLAIR